MVLFLTASGNQNRKLLEQLEEQKKRLRMQTQAGSGSSSVSVAARLVQEVYLVVFCLFPNH